MNLRFVYSQLCIGLIGGPLRGPLPFVLGNPNTVLFLGGGMGLGTGSLVGLSGASFF